ncbi:hypothetical protein [Chryseobacterium caseinilyticum]|uniref:Uncharacterized protein n=1 Tax=Chryseobacterium caseinilyticum TaxID=2771428 RepID=A0ABR8Z783_9FLAO|nr:hypothetical protein [Chryseobacterium caseinilyticum]MBD8081108.1 hypothetical protein [Chryseobacterium caseinilyticum]
MNKANALNKKIKEYEEALNCFEHRYGENNEFVFDRTPKILLDVDDLDDGREQIPIPMILSDELAEFLKEQILSNLNLAKEEFINL